MSSGAALSWGRAHRAPCRTIPVWSRHASLPDVGNLTALPYGNGRSYGDSNLNPGGVLLTARGLDRFIAFDPQTGLLTCEAGVMLADILRLVVPQGWFVPVTPGTQFVTVGGAIANDVHGKNYRAAGAFGNHVTWLELLRSDGSRRVCSPTEHADWFSATIGGLGLTGFITSAQLQLRRIANPFIDAESIRFGNLDEFFALSRASENDYEYTVSWIDCAFGGARLGRGIFNRGNHASPMLDTDLLTRGLATPVSERALRMPVTPPLSLINTLSLKAFNTAYYNKQSSSSQRGLQHYRPFFYPLDAIQEWNRVYGPRGFYQYQSVVPKAHAQAVTGEMLATISASGMGSFLAVLKEFSDVKPRGMLSFPQPGTTLALDFPNVGADLHRLFDRLDAIVSAAGGRLYSAKDGRMGAGIFKSGYPQWVEFERYVDPKFSSGLWRRVTEQQ